MIIGVPKEIKRLEFRVAITPSGAHELVRDGHRVIVERGAGTQSGFSDEEYLMAGAEVTDKESLFRMAELIVKVKEPLPEEFHLFREGQIVFTYLHLAPNRELIDFLMERKITALAYETFRKDGDLPLLAPMSEIAGRMAPIVASFYLQKRFNSSGILPTGVSGVRPAKALIIGAGNVGLNSARVCHGMGMETVVLNRGIERLKRIDELFHGRIKTLVLTENTLIEEIKDSDIVICAVLVPGARTPVIIKRDFLKIMKKGSIIVDVAIDQGGCCETSKPTTHDDPIYEVDGIIHYAVTNMPGAYPRTSTIALTNATFPYLRLIAKGLTKAIEIEPCLKTAINIQNGMIVHEVLKKSMNQGVATSL